MDELELELRVGFLDEAAGLLSDTEQCFLALENNPDAATIDKIFRLAHNFKGSAGAVGFAELAAFAHKFESFLLKIKGGDLKLTTVVVNVMLECNDFLAQAIATLKADLSAKIGGEELIGELLDYIEGRKTSAAAVAETPSEAVVASEPVAEVQDAPTLPAPEARETASQSAAAVPASVEVESAPTPVANAGAKTAAVEENIRVSLSKLENLLNSVGEIVILQTVLQQQRFQIPSPLLQKTIVQLSKITKDLQTVAMSLRMLPIKQTFGKMNRIVRDTSKALGKDIELHISGDETEVDKTVLEQLGDPLVHLVRNAADHGVENSEDRVRAGKAATGNIYLSAYHSGSQLVVEIRDDGRGLDAEKLKKKAIEKGILAANRTLSESEAHQLIFAPGFSTKAEVTDISGRGVGMDVVKTNLQKLKGEIQIETVVGKGTTFRILLPLTLAIIDGMVVLSHEQRYVVPISNVHESVQPEKSDVHQVTGVGEVLNLRGENLPLFRLSGLMGQRTHSATPWESIALIVRESEKPYAVLVDDIIGQQQVVIKQLGKELRHIRGLSGGAILGDGKAALIVDIKELVTSSGQTGAGRMARA